MQIKGKWLDDVKSEKGLAYFEDMYETTPAQMMEDYDTNRVTIMTSDYVKYIAFIESDGTQINMLFTLDGEDDYVAVYAQEGLESCGVFNTDGIAFMSAGDKLFSIENSPYDVAGDDLEEMAEQEDVTVDYILSLVAPDATLQNTRFVAQL